MKPGKPEGCYCPLERKRENKKKRIKAVEQENPLSVVCMFTEPKENFEIPSKDTKGHRNKEHGGSADSFPTSPALWIGRSIFFGVTLLIVLFLSLIHI